jgi:putative tryptophan/tyrosine transport system permease protein
VIELLQTGAIDGLLFSLVGLAVLISFGWLRFPDLTPDGSFILGGAVFAAAVGQGAPPAISIVLSAMAGSAAGLITGILSVSVRIPNVISSLITVTAVYSLSWLIMGRPTTFVEAEDVLWAETSDLPVVALICIAVSIFVWRISFTLFGIRLRALGENPILTRDLGISELKYTLVGLGISNALAGGAGGLFSQRILVADVNSGVGVTLSALIPLFAAGALITSRRHIALTISLILVFSVIYRSVLGLVMLLAVPGELFRMVTALTMVAVFALAQGRRAPLVGSVRWI